MRRRIVRVIEEFKEFAVRGNVVDMAVGIIIGAAFGKIVSSLVEDIVMPPVAMVTKKINFNDLYLNLSGGDFATLTEAKKAGAITINYGLFFNHILSFMIVAVCIFFLVRQINRLKRKEDSQAIAPTQRPCPFCYSKISVKATKCPYCTSELTASDRM